jgi:hypothetical protein
MSEFRVRGDRLRRQPSGRGGGACAAPGFGRWVGMFAAALSVIAALLSIPAYPFWSLCIFALAIIIIYELAKAPERHTVS